MAASSDNSQHDSVAEMLATSAQFLSGVGPQRAELLARRGLRTARDLLFFFPRDYEEVGLPCAIDELTPGELGSVIGEVEEAELRELGEGRSVFGLLVRQGQQHLRAVWFNQAFVARRYRRGQRVRVTGKAKRRTLTWEMSHPRCDVLAEDEEPRGELLPVYALTEGLRQPTMRRIMQGVVERFADELEEVFPSEHLQRRDLATIDEALRGIHMPENRLQLERARRRLVYQELLVLQLALAVRRWQLSRSRPATELPVTAKIDARIRRLFPFEFTGDQEQAVREVCADMQRDFPMNRLLQGDVGTGKTVVAMYAMLLAAAHSRQSVMMAPTEVLARQHARTLERSLAASRVRIGLLTGSLTPARRRELLEQVRDGQIDIVVGTHAIANAVAQSEVEFAKLALAVVDEQHKFGVRHRAVLRSAAVDPHYLVMTATPIPRTVSMTLFGDLDVSVLRQSPPGRQNVHTYLGSDNTRQRWWDFFARKLREGRQGYVVAPTVEEREDHVSAEEAFEALANGPLEPFRLDLVHGRMGGEQKDQAMRRFESGDTQVLVATSLVEVGIDVPNATLMTVEGGERFGLAQLHQLRGRIRRGTHPGFLCVFANPGSPEAQQRLEALRDVTDGFELAELDFKLRGPGDLFGTQQHGLPPLRIADLRQDTELLELARRDAQQWLEDDPGLEHTPRLRRMVLLRYGDALELSGVG